MFLQTTESGRPPEGAQGAGEGGEMRSHGGEEGWSRMGTGGEG